MVVCRMTLVVRKRLKQALEMQHNAKMEVANAKLRMCDELYERLNTKEGDKDM